MMELVQIIGLLSFVIAAISLPPALIVSLAPAQSRYRKAITNFSAIACKIHVAVMMIYVLLFVLEVIDEYEYFY